MGVVLILMITATATTPTIVVVVLVTCTGGTPMSIRGGGGDRVKINGARGT